MGTVKFVIRCVIGLMLVAVLVFGALFWSPRPPNTTNPAVLAGDGSLVNYCVQTELDGSGLNAIDIPKANTPGCGYSHFPLPVLTECTEPLPLGSDDIRGLWQEVGGKHVERIEQCGRRVVITTSGVIHDYGPNSTLGENTNDVEGVAFHLNGQPYCPRTSASMIWNHGVLDFHAFGWGPVVVRRYLDGEQLVWEYLNGTVTRMNRVCTLPSEILNPAR